MLQQVENEIRNSVAGEFAIALSESMRFRMALTEEGGNIIIKQGLK